MFIDFDTTSLFGAPDLWLTPLTQYKLLSANPMHMKIHIEAQHECLTQHNYFNRIDDLQHHPNDDLGEALDQTRMRACLCAEAKVPCCPDVPHLLAMTNTRSLFNILKCCYVNASITSTSVAKSENLSCATTSNSSFHNPCVMKHHPQRFEGIGEI
jgi:hypothetical protein